MIRLTLGKKMGIFIGIILFVFLVQGIVSYLQLKKVEGRLSDIIHVEKPKSAAAYEMEINLIGTGFGLLGYLESRDPKHLDRIKKDIMDFGKFQKVYEKLSHTVESREYGKLLREEYEKFKLIAYKIIKLEDEQVRKLNLLAEYYIKADDILDEKIQAATKQDNPQLSIKLQASLEMEININENVKNLGNYLRTHQEKYKKFIIKDSKHFWKFINIYKNLDLSSDEKKWAENLNDIFVVCMKLTEDIMDINKQIGDNRDHFIRIRRSMDSIMDENIQVLTDKALKDADMEASQSIVFANIMTLTLLFIGLLVGIICAMAISRLVIKPIQNLKNAVTDVGMGKLNTKIEILSSDEIGDLAKTFNKMTTDLKEISDEERKKTVDLLRLTNEMEKTKAGLEDKVKERTYELHGKLKELERFRNATIDREFRMKELTDEIAELKRKLKEG
jgi:HAMP domain-containing protein